MSGLKFYVLDSETTGLRHSWHSITEIGIIRCTDKVQLWHQIICEHPERSSVDALAITKKTLEDLKHGITKEQAVAECEKFFNEDDSTPAGRCIIGHNVAFDRRFLHALWESCGKSFPANLWLDTIALTKDFAKKQGIIKPKVNLHAACDLVGVNKIATAHTAKHDSRNTYLLYKKLTEEKNIDYLPFIKTAAHITDDDERMDPSLLDIED